MTHDRISPLTARAVVSTVLIVGLVALASSSGLHAAMIRVFAGFDRIIAQHPTAGATVFVLLAALSAMLAFFSSAVLVAPAVYAWGPVLTAFLLWLGWMLGGVAAYTLARLLGRPVVQRLASATLLAQLEQRLTQRTPFGVVLLIQLAFPSEIPGYLLGLVRYSPSVYLLALAIAELPYAVGTVLLGEGFVERRIGLLLALGAAALVAAVVLSRALRGKLRQDESHRRG
ncbi:MAG: TVP38/TMEM64 family protein [Gemmatimonadaceae bacterium]|nr:TVP38/TMEM64 family protein [Gemmatimonadaceae bacterium]